MKALYVNGKFVRFERSKATPEKVVSSEWIDVIEDEDPIPSVNQVVVRDQIRENGKHRKRKVLRDKTMDEIESEAYEEDRAREQAILKALFLEFKNGTATNRQEQRALAYLIKHAL